MGVPDPGVDEGAGAVTTVPLRHAVHINSDVLPESTPSDFSFRYIDISQVTSTGDVQVPVEPTIFGEAPSRARRIARPGDTVVSTVRTYLRAIAAVPESADPLVFSTGFAVLRSKTLDAGFLTYACRSEPFIDEVVARSVGVSYPAINLSDLLDLRIPSPPLEQQRRIADFLDDRVSRINRIIAARREQVDLVRSIPWLDFSAALGSIPTIPLRRGIATLVDGPFGSAYSSADYVDSGPAVIRLGNIGFADFRDTDLARVTNSLYERFPQAHVRPGDLLIASLGDARNHAGRACLVPPGLGPAMVKGKCFRARANPKVASTEFLAVLLSSPRGADALVQQGTGSTRSMLNFERLLSSRVPIPSRAEQEGAVDSFRSNRDHSAGTEAALTHSISLLAEYRTSLITAAVTGDLDVTTAGSNIPE